MDVGNPLVQLTIETMVTERISADALAAARESTAKRTAVTDKEAGKEIRMKAVSPGKERKAKACSTEETWNLRLYVAGQTPKSITALANLKKICEEHLAGKYNIEVIDLYQQPGLAKGEQIIAAPTLIKTLPLPLRRLIGDMSDTEKVLMGMDLKAKTS